jgi:hypothetical protein
MTGRCIIALTICSLAHFLAGFVATPAVAQGQPLVFLGPCGEFGYRPVCARARGNVLVTYANACIARSEGARVLSQGSCPVACPMIYKPVCTIDAAGQRKTYANDCQAKAAGATVIRSWRCLR